MLNNLQYAYFCEKKWSTDKCNLIYSERSVCMYTEENVTVAMPEDETDENGIDFMSLKVSRVILKAIYDLGWKVPTPVQVKSIPPALAGKDLFINAVTGSGKTAAFMIPVLERLLFTFVITYIHMHIYITYTYITDRTIATRVLVVTPTRELAAQCMQMTNQLSKYAPVTVTLVVGGLDTQTQEISLRRKPDIVICTPGRMIDLVRNSRGVTLDDVEILVLDEADRLLDMGFLSEIEELVSHLPKERQTMLLSATLTDDVYNLAKFSLTEPDKIAVDPSLCLANKLSQVKMATHYIYIYIYTYIHMHIKYKCMKEKLKMLFCSLLLERGGSLACLQIGICSHLSRPREIALCNAFGIMPETFHIVVIVFCRTKKETHLLRLMFGLMGLKAAELHGNMSQLDRLDALKAFREREVDYLLCTDVAARGIDIEGVQTVINIEFPTNIKTYIHRVGRTARAGCNGHAVTLVGEQRKKLLKTLINSSSKQNDLKLRTINPEFVYWCNEQILDMKITCKNIISEEQSEREMRISTILLNKSQNMLSHANEIFNKPKKNDALFGDLGEEYANEMKEKINRRIEETLLRKKQLESGLTAREIKQQEKRQFEQMSKLEKERFYKKKQEKLEKQQKKKEINLSKKLASQAMIEQKKLRMTKKENKLNNQKSQKNRKRKYSEVTQTDRLAGESSREIRTLENMNKEKNLLVRKKVAKPIQKKDFKLTQQHLLKIIDIVKNLKIVFGFNKSVENHKNRLCIFESYKKNQCFVLVLKDENITHFIQKMLILFKKQILNKCSYIDFLAVACT
ncbi:DEAD/DEAH box helicase, partial [Reticulomyxa filosa]